MGVFGAVFGRRGDGGFSGPLLGVCSGVVGFNVAMFLRPVSEKVHPVQPGSGESAKKFALQARNRQKMAFSGALGEFFRGRAAERAALGEFFRGRAVHGAHSARVVRSQYVWVLLVSGENFACNSPQGVPYYERASLQFCRFVPVEGGSSAGIACEIVLRGPVLAAKTQDLQEGGKHDQLKQ